MLKKLSAKIRRWITTPQNALQMLACGLAETVPPHDLTITRLSVTEMRIRTYWKIHGYLPASLADLPILEGRDNTTIDGWGKAIKYIIIGTSVITLSSSGPEAAAGGMGLNQDILVTFDANEEMT